MQSLNPKNLFRLGAAFIIVFCLICIGFPDFSQLTGLGKAEDKSRFVSARLAQEGTLVVFSYSRILYRPPVGWRQFPDGGAGVYTTDINFIGSYNLKTKKQEILVRRVNDEWCGGQGAFSIFAAYGSKVIVSEGGQLRSNLELAHRFYWLEIEKKNLIELPIDSELENIQKSLGNMYLIGTDGSLLLVTPPLNSTVSERLAWNRDPLNSPLELWIRFPDAVYKKIARGVRYEGIFGDEIFYYEGSRGGERGKSIAYNLKSGAYRNILPKENRIKPLHPTQDDFRHPLISVKDTEVSIRQEGKEESGYIVLPIDTNVLR